MRIDISPKRGRPQPRPKGLGLPLDKNNLRGLNPIALIIGTCKITHLFIADETTSPTVRYRSTRNRNAQHTKSMTCRYRQDTVYQTATLKIAHAHGQLSILQVDILFYVVRMIERHSSPFADMGASMVAAMPTRPSYRYFEQNASILSIGK